jgi:hypothetical protein
MKIQSGTFADIPKGTKLTVPNPKWDGDKPKTQFYLEIEAKESMCIEVRGDYQVKILS